MWFNKRDERALYFDRRDETVTIPPGNAYPNGADIEIRPDVRGDFTKMPFPDETFALVVFDPPHFDKLGETSILAKCYGKLFGDWECDLAAGFSECFRVLRRDGVLIFKWCSIQIPLERVLALAKQPPLFGHRGGMREKTHWVAFIKHNGAVAPATQKYNE